MEDIELKNIWKAHEEKLDKSLKLNYFLLESIQTQKAKSKLHSLAAFKTGAVILGIVWLLFLGMLLYGNHFKNVFFS